MPRYRQKLAFVPFGLHDPVWVDDPEFDIRRHVLHSTAHNIDHLLERVFSTPLDRDRPLWEVWIADQLEDGRIGLVGKAHHCMVDGIAAVELASLFLDTSPEAAPGAARRLAAGFRAGTRCAARGGASRPRWRESSTWYGFRPASRARPDGCSGSPATPARRRARCGTRVIGRRAAERLQRADLAASAPRQGAPAAWRTCCSIKERYGMTLNDVVLAVSAGGVRRFLQQHGEPPIA